MLFFQINVIVLIPPGMHLSQARTTKIRLNLTSFCHHLASLGYYHPTLHLMTFGSSPDGKVLDPLAHPHFGILEVKCPYKYRSVKPREAAAMDKDFCLASGTPGNNDLYLRKSHHHYSQVQGQIMVTGAKWCDFVVYTFKGLHIERIAFDDMFCHSMLNKLNAFYFGNYLKHAKV